MAAAPVPEEIQNHFSLAKITWKINNISLGLCDSNEVIPSPVFVVPGRIDTQWRMHLTFSDIHNVLSIRLRLLDYELKKSENEDLKAKRKNSEDSKVTNEDTKAKKEFNFYLKKSTFKINWVAYVFEKPMTIEGTFHFQKHTELTVSTFELSEVFTKLPQMEPDNLEVTSFILVDFEYDAPLSQPEILYSALSFSEALSKLPENECFSDFKIECGNCTFHLHKDMLLHEGYGLRALVGFQDPLNPRATNILNYDGTSIGSIFRFLYSGNLEYILAPLSVNVSDYIERLEISELKQAYPKAIITMESNIEGEELCFTWRIENFETIQNNLDGPRLYARNAELRWQLHLHPKGPVKRSESPAVARSQEKYVFFAATLLESEKPIDVCLEFACVDESNKILYNRRVQEKMVAGNQREVDYFLRGGTNMRKCLIDKALLLRFTVRRRTGRVSTVLEGIIPHVPDPCFIINQSIARGFFRSRLLYMLENIVYPDLIFSNEEKEFKAHRFIMAVNSPNLHGEMICRNQNPYRIILRDPTRFVKIFLDFLYSGLMRERELIVSCHLYEMASRYNINNLLLTCTDEITRDVANYFFAIEYADQMKLPRLRFTTMNTMANRAAEVTRHPMWTTFAESRPGLAVEIGAHMRKIYLSSRTTRR